MNRSCKFALPGVFLFPLAVLTLLLAVLPPVRAVELGVSRPAGVAAAWMPSNSLTLVSMPFFPLEASPGDLFGRQLLPLEDPGGGDELMLWDPAKGDYVTLFRHQPEEDASGAGDWWIETEAGDPRPVELDLGPGDAFWVRSGAAHDRQFYLAGELNLLPTTTRELLPGINLAGNPYAGVVTLGSLGLGRSGAWAPADAPGDRLSRWDAAAGEYFSYRLWGAGEGTSEWRPERADPFSTEPLLPAEGFLYDRRGAGRFSWNASAPWADPFDPAGTLPEIVDILPELDTKRIRLGIRAVAGADLPLHVLRQEMDAETPFDPLSWELIETFQSGGHVRREWTGPLPTGPDRLHAYLVVRGDLDRDGDGIPDGLEVFVHGSDPFHADSDRDGIPDGWELRHGLDPLDATDAAASKAGDGISNLAKYRRGLDPSRAFRADRRNRLRLRVATPLEK